MPSPFPGMDPYLEDPFFWHQVHSRLIVALANDLGRKLRPKYYAAIEIRTYLEDGLDTVFVGILEERYLEIRNVGSKEVIAAIELLSPKNKRGEGRKIYLKKRQVILETASHFIEIDLLRLAQPMRVEGASGKSDYRILVSDASKRPNADLYSFNLRDAIPVFPLPLRSEDESVPVDLGTLLQEIYDQGCLDLQIDYHQPVPEPILSKEDIAWVENIIRSGST
jgi:hypothetical protein